MDKFEVGELVLLGRGTGLRWSRCALKVVSRVIQGANDGREPMEYPRRSQTGLCFCQVADAMALGLR